MKRLILLLLFIFSISVVFAFGQINQALPDKLWQEVDDSALQQGLAERLVIPTAYRTFTLNKTALQNLLQKAPMEFTAAAGNNSVIITVPMPDGKRSFPNCRIADFRAGISRQTPGNKNLSRARN